MNNSDEIIIRITKDYKLRIEEEKDNLTSFKEIDPKTFFECIKNCIKYEGVSSGLLPNHTISFSMDTNGNRYISMLYTETRADITYFKTTYRNFPLPRLIFGFKVSEEGRILSKRMGVLELGKITNETKMYHYPFSNVNGFSICTGSNPMPVIKSLYQLNSIPHGFAKQQRLL